MTIKKTYPVYQLDIEPLADYITYCITANDIIIHSFTLPHTASEEDISNHIMLFFKRQHG